MEKQHDDADGKPRNGRGGVILAVLSLVLFAAIIFAGVYVYRYLNENTDLFRAPRVPVEEASDDRLVVPDLTGVRAGRAESMVSPLKLTAEKAPSQEKAGTVIWQEPEAGARVEPGTEVRVLVSAGPADIDLPSADGETVSSLASSLHGSGIHNIRYMYEYGADREPGDIISMDPVGHTASGQPVTLTVCAGTKPAVAYPREYTGMEEQEAVRTAAADRLFPVSVYVYSEFTESGRVAAQSVDRDAPVAAGSVVTFLIASDAASRPETGSPVDVSLALPDTATGGKWVMTAEETTENGDFYELVADSGDASPQFPYHAQVPCVNGAVSILLRYYEQNAEGAWVPRAYWKIR